MNALRQHFHAGYREKLERLIRATPSPGLATSHVLRLVESSGATPFNRIPAADLPPLLRLLGSSVYLSDILVRAGASWPELFLGGLRTATKTRDEHLGDLAPALARTDSFDQFCASLRRHKQREFIRIGTRDLLSEVSMEETVRELTALAEACLEASYRFSRAEVEKSRGTLLLPQGTASSRFAVLGMGKLGGAELNFSSDVDVIFLYEDDEGESTGASRGGVAPREFFGEVATRMIKAMGEVTEDGFVFRIDLRLRPLGAHGPLVQSVNSAMVYYESWGQCWERAALIKARPVAGDLELGRSFLDEIEPFIYRRYLDYTTVDELRHMKLRIENELLDERSKERNIKLGVGGIREIEFFTQALQLVNGGYVPAVRGGQTIPALAALASNRLIPAGERDRLTEAYRFLRQVEHKVQIVQEAHAHSIPEGDEEERWLARRLGYKARGKQGERELFWRDHRKHTTTVRATFDRLFYGAQKEISAGGAPAAASIWNDLDQQEPITRELGRMGFADPHQAYENLLAIRDGEVHAPPSARRLKVMRTLGPALITEIAKAAVPDQALFNLARFTHRIGGRTGFLTLLAEKPDTMRLLVTLFAESQFLTDLFLNRPELIDTLIRVDLSRIVKPRESMAAELGAALAEQNDIEGKLNGLRRYKTEEFIRIGLHDLGGKLDLVPVLHQLSDLAEVCVAGALAFTSDELRNKYGGIAAGRFAILAGGKTGGRELDYNSDLDLVFVYDAAEDEQTIGAKQGKLPAHEYYVRLGQKLITYLSAPTEEGLAYKIDMQLRPSGKSGPLVSSLEAFREYHRTSSQLWERQALIKTRRIAGDPTLGREIEQIAENFAYARPLTPADVGEIHHLRMRMERELAHEDETRFNLKKGRGGLVDIEFLTQMLQLAHGRRHRKLRRRETLTALTALRETRILTQSEYRLLFDGYLFLRRLDHRLRLERDQSIDAFDAEPRRLDGIARALGYRSSEKSGKAVAGRSGQRLLRDYQRRRERIRACYERYFKPTAETGTE